MVQKKKYILVLANLMIFSLCSCGQDTESIKENVETSISEQYNYEEDISVETIVNITNNEETTTVQLSTEELTTLETTSESTTIEQSDLSATQQETTVQSVATTKQLTTSKKEKQTKEETTTTAEFVENGTNIWKYRSDIYANDPVKSELGQIFWNEYGWTAFSKEKNDEMVRATVEIVYDIMQNNKTDFERERALYEAICISCNYDHESLETGLTEEGQRAYGVFVEHKAVCGGYASTFHIALSMMGIKNRLIIGSTTEGLHAWNQVCLDGEWYQVDVTWGDGDDDFSYAWFNLTSEEMSNTHEVREENCTGTKYSEKYLIDKYLPEFLADKVYLSTVDEVINYINTKAENGIAKTIVYAPEEVCGEVTNIIRDPVIFNEKYPFSDKINEMYCEYGFSCEYAPYYKHVSLKGIGMIEIEYRSVK